jgi:hypothetical protein
VIPYTTRAALGTADVRSSQILLTLTRAPMSIAYGARAHLVRFLFISAAVVSFAFANAAYAAGNSIDNPSFEDGAAGAATNWTADNSVVGGSASLTITTDAADVHTGVRAAKVEITSLASGDAKWLPIATTTTAGKYYIFSDWYKSSTTTQIGFFANDGFHWIKDLPSTGGTWQQFQTDILIPTGVTSIQMAHLLYGVGTLVTDDYSLVEQTSPTLSQGRVTLSFDDGWNTFSNNAFPISRLQA